MHSLSTTRGMPRGSTVVALHCLGPDETDREKRSKLRLVSFSVSFSAFLRVGLPQCWVRVGVSAHTIFFSQGGERKVVL